MFYSLFVIVVALLAMAMHGVERVMKGNREVIIVVFYCYRNG